jgi:hypothetical protein
MNEKGGLTELNLITERIIGCAIEVHRNLGPELLESLYEKAMAVELAAAGLSLQGAMLSPSPIQKPGDRNPQNGLFC